MASRARLLKQDPYTPGDIRIRRTFADVEIVVPFLRVVERSDPVQRLRMVLADCLCQLCNSFHAKRIIPGRDTRLKEERRVRSHLVVVRQDVRSPLIVLLQSCPALRVLQRHPIAIEIEPVMICPASRPGFVVLSAARIGNGLLSFVHVCPRSESVQAVGIDGRIEQDDCFLQLPFDLRALSSGKVVSDKHRGVRAARFVPMHAVAHPDEDGHHVDIE